jgi:HSF-type DNA-binding
MLGFIYLILQTFHHSTLDTQTVNLWGFQTIQEGPNKGGCYHPLFIRGNREKVHYMTRQKVKGSQGKAPAKSATKIPLTQGQSSLPSLAEIAVATNPGLMTALKEAKNSIFSEDELKALPFMKKLHHILAQPDMGDCIGWTPDGRCIRVIDPFKFLDKAQSYFDHTSFSSFLVELESYGFKKVTHMGIAECYYHDVSCSLD